MGQNASTVHECRAHVANTTSIPVEFAPNYYEGPPVVVAVGTDTRPYKAPRSDVRPYKAPRSDVQPHMAPRSDTRPHKAPRSNRIITFHSKACWSGYLESSKAFPNLVVIYFTNAWYEPCRYMEPTFNEFASTYTNVEFIRMDMDELCEISQRYGVRTMPTFLFIKRGRQIDKVVGARKEELQFKIEKHRTL